MTDHLAYEISMVADTALALKELEKQPANLPQDQVARNSLIESYAVHVRVLLSFLYQNPFENPKLPSTSAYAGDLFDDPGEWASAHPRMNSKEESIYSRVSARIAHLSYQRLDDRVTERAWDLDYTLDLLQRLEELVTQASPTRLGSRIRSELRVKLHLLRIERQTGTVLRPPATKTPR